MEKLTFGGFMLQFLTNIVVAVTSLAFAAVIGIAVIVICYIA